MKKWKTEIQLINEWNQIKAWIKKTVQSNGFEKVILGLSGGFDSGFLAFTAAQEDCLGKENVVAVSMPCDSIQNSKDDAEELACKLGIIYFVDNIDVEVNDRVSSVNFARSTCFALPKMTSTEVGNVKARMRMLTLYGYAPAFNTLVMNTSNKSEALAGNGTKYGDIAGDFAPILGYTKTTLYRMAKAVGFDKVSPAIFNKVPTADLEPNQTDEGTMGVTYKNLDAFIEDVDTDDDGKYIEIDEDTSKKIHSLMKKSWHKRNPMSVFVPEI